MSRERSIHRARRPRLAIAVGHLEHHLAKTRVANEAKTKSSNPKSYIGLH